MNEKTKKILKISAIALGEMALLTLGFAVGACSAKAGSKQQTAITTPVAKSLISRPKKVNNQEPTGVWQPNGRTQILMGIAYDADYEISFTCNGVSYDSLSFVFGDNPVNLKRPNMDFIGRPKKMAEPWESVFVAYYSNGVGTLAYNGPTGWVLNSDISITNVDNVSNTSNLLETLALFYNKTADYVPEPTPDPEPDPEPTPLPEIKEKVVLNSSYDFRRWFGNVDPTTGAIQFKLPTGISLYSVRVGGLEWQNLGNERIYNCIEFTLQPLNASNALAVSDKLAKTAESLYGDKYTEFCMLSGVYYSYQSGYDGTYTVIQDSALPSVDYRDRIYSMPMVSAQLDGTANNVNALDIRNCVIPSIYRSFGIIEDSGVIFSTNGYSSVTLRQLLGMDFSSVVNYSEGTASAFSLLTQAFGSVAGLLAVQVLPNITLGLLIFLPLIGAVIVLVIKAVKK